MHLLLYCFIAPILFSIFQIKIILTYQIGTVLDCKDVLIILKNDYENYVKNKEKNDSFLNLIFRLKLKFSILAKID